MSNIQNDKKYPYGYGLGKISLAKLYMNKANVMTWSGILSGSSFIVLTVWFILLKDWLKVDTYKFLDNFVASLAFFIWGCLGLFWAYRRQVPQAVMVKGKPAYFMGIFTMIFGWFLSLRFLIDGIQSVVEILMK